MFSCVFVNLTPFPIRVRERNQQVDPYVAIIKPGESCRLPCSGQAPKTFMLSTLMSQPYFRVHLWSRINLPGEIPIAKLGVTVKKKPHCDVRRRLMNPFKINCCFYAKGVVFEMSYDPGLCQLCTVP